ncbi:MAG: prolyl oligopeptidase family serine peptidase [Gaiellales bacterium]|nr:prolyl oligopeptidase family serine peptidase [Gaiellales bacterium]
MTSQAHSFLPCPPDIFCEDLRFLSLAAHRHTAGRRPDDAGRPPLLAATLFLPANAHPGPARLPGLLVAHGAGSCRARHRGFCFDACHAGFAVLGIDFRGHGDSGGLADGPLECDILAAVNLLRTHPLVDPHRIGYRGSSMGGYYGVRAAVDADFAAVAVLCPANEEVLLRAMERKHEWSTRSNDGLEARLDDEALIEFYRHHRLADDAEMVRNPVLIAHARGDERVPFQHSLDLAAALGDEADLWLFPEGSHTSLQSSPLVHRRVLAWLTERLA